MNTDQLKTATKELVKLAEKLPDSGLGQISRVQAGLTLLITLEIINTQQNQDPTPLLQKALNDARGLISAACSVVPELINSNSTSLTDGNNIGHTIDLFENAWTTFTPETYDHSVALVRKRLINSGFDQSWFTGKCCFDGGCGTGRLAIAMAQMGAKKVTAIDLGGESLNYFRQAIERYELSNIEIIQHDVTDLSPWESDTYDFVASNGVLHHTENCNKGIREHFRITKPGGIFWIYLYGDGGLYWSIYDELKPMLLNIPPADIRKILTAFELREGLIYTYLDNFLAPRVYYTRDQFLQLLAEEGVFTWQHAKGTSEIDDTQILLETAYGAQIYGPQGEVRLIITKK